MEFSRPPLVVAFELSEKRKAIVADTVAGASDVVYLTEFDEAARADALRNAGVLLTFNTSKELRSGEAKITLPAGRASGAEKLAGIRSPAEAGPTGQGFQDEVLIRAGNHSRLV
jgi:hypothetical protein